MTTKSSRDEQEPLRDATKDSKNVFLPEERTPRLTWQQSLACRLRVKSDYARVFLAEFLGTMILIAVGVGSGAQASLGTAKGGAHGSIHSIIFGWGLAVTLGVFVSGGASGGHINPAVTGAMALLGRTPLRKVPFYLLGQYLGSIAGSLIAYVVYIDALDTFDGGVRKTPNQSHATAGIWATFPQDHISVLQGFGDQIVGTGILMLVVMAITDEHNMHVPKGLVPFGVGLTVTALLASYEYNAGAALNPCRDLGNRIFLSMAGWGAAPFSFRNYSWFWVPVVAPHIGAILGALLYNICVGLHWPELNPYQLS